MEINPNNTQSLTPVPVKLDKDGNVDLATISPEEVKKYSEINKSLVPSDVNSILNYGVEAQNSMEKYSNDFLSSVRTYNSGDVGGLINELLTELNYIDVTELEQSGFKSFISKSLF